MSVEARRQRDEANAQAALATSRYLAAQGVSELATRPTRALLLGVEALNAADTAEARGALLFGLQENRQIRRYLQDDVNRRGAVFDITFSLDGKKLASGALNGSVTLWNTVNGQRVNKPLTGHDDWVTDVAYSRRGTLLASAGRDGKIIVRDADNGEEVGIAETGLPAQAVDFHPNGWIMASGHEGDESADGYVFLWDLRSGKNEVIETSAVVKSLSFSKGGDVLAASVGSGIMHWDARTRVPLGPIIETGDFIQDIKFSPDNKTLAAGGGDRITFWDLRTHKPRGRPIKSKEYIYGIAFSPDGRTMAASDLAGKVTVWDTKTHRRIWHPLTGGGSDGGGAVYSVSYSPDGEVLASASGDGNIILWNVPRSPRPGHVVWDEEYPLRTASFLPSDRRAIRQLDLSPNGNTVASVTTDGKAWLTNTGSPPQRLGLGDGSSIRDVQFSHDGETLVTAGSDNVIRFWDATARKEVEEVSEPLRLDSGTADGALRRLALSHDGNRLATADDTYIRLWDLRARRQLGDPIDTGAMVEDIAFSPDGRTIASANFDSSTRIWNADTHEQVGEPLPHNDTVSAVAYSPDGRTLATGGFDSSVILWDAKTGKELAQLPSPTGMLNSIIFSPNGSTIAAGTHDPRDTGQATTVLWDVHSRRTVGQLRTAGRYVSSVDFSRDGRILAAGGEDGTAVLWSMDSDTWIRRACQIANRRLSRTEWRQFVGPEHPHMPSCGN